MTHNKEKLIKRNRLLEMIKMMELADKNVKIANINTFYIIMRVERNELDRERSGRY